MILANYLTVKIYLGTASHAQIFDSSMKLKTGRCNFNDWPIPKDDFFFFSDNRRVKVERSNNKNRTR